MQINSLAHVHGPQSLSAPHRASGAQPSGASGRASHADQLDISREASYVSQARDLPAIRSEKVAELRQAIQSGRYETEEKLELAVGRLLNEIG